MLTLFSQEEAWDMHVRNREKEAAEKAAWEAAIRTTVEDGQDYGIPREEVLSKLRCKYGLSEMDAREK
ncbi:MAG: hypothetical protein HFH35_13605 [Eubacterium sp.]|nr:hypothetical protein [Eubacterium sp.]